MTQEQNKNWIEQVVRDFCASPANSLENGTGEPAWGEPQVAYARGDDLLFAQVKSDIGPFYWTPQEAFKLAYPDAQIDPSELTVICYILPQTDATPSTNAQRQRFRPKGGPVRASMVKSSTVHCVCIWLTH